MKVENRGSLPTGVVEGLVDYVSKHFRYPFMARLLLEDREKPGMRGQADKDDARPDRDRWAPSCIHIAVGSATYPRVSRYVLGDVRVESWQEEFVLTLAHEIGHIDCGWDVDYQFTGIQDEEELVEAKAIQILARWKKSRRKRRVSVDNVSAHM